MLQNKKRGERNKVGAWGEQIAAAELRRRGFAILSLNYLKKWGEIDIVARKGETVHFVEVKTVSYETKGSLRQAVTRGTWRPEEQVHQNKLGKLYRVIESWLMEHDFEGDWQIDVAAVRVVPREKYATWQFIENIIE